MRQKLIITDLTQMPDGNKVCVVGISEQGRTIRPVHEGGFLKDYLYHNSKLTIFPSAIVEFDLIEESPEPPHIEDMVFDPVTIKSHGSCDTARWERTLLTTSSNTVAQIYEGNLRYGKWVAPGALTRSIATLSGSTKHAFAIEVDRAPKPRILFVDSSGNEYDLSVSDLAIREFCFNEIIREGNSAVDIADRLNKALAKVSKIYLRIGLARPFKYKDTGTEHCYAQVTGIHTFPDYLDGKTFADFAKRY